jgi:sugar O-acyltransferase (sialic acid O-acetyltransferase NeuD family)
MADIVFFGVSNLLSDFFDCAIALGHRVRGVVYNQSEIVRPRTRSVRSRLNDLTPPPAFIALADFRGVPGEIYALGTTHPARSALVEELTQEFQLELTALVHPAAYVSPFAHIGPGCFVGAGAIIAPGVVLDPHAFINRAVSIGHDTHIGAFARLQAGCHIGGHVVIGPDCTIGLGAKVIEELEIGAGAFVAAGAVVINDVPAKARVMGIPARPKGSAGS